MEQWCVVKDYPKYRISTLGRIRSSRGLLKPVKHVGGYLYINLYGDKGHKQVSVHRLVAEAFIKNPDNRPNIDHINRDPSDNRVENLRWCNQSENLLNPLTIAYRSLMIDGRRAVDVARDNGVPKETFYRRIRRGWSAQEASVVPPKIYTSLKRKLKMKRTGSTEGRVVPSV